MTLDFKRIKINQTEQTEQAEQPPENQFLEQSSTTLTTETPENQDAPPTHFDSLIDNAAPEQVEDKALVLNNEEFHKLFCMAFNTGSAISGLKSLEVDDADGSVIACTNSIHEMCLEIPALRFLIQPQGKWGTRIFAIGAFAVPMALAVTAEVKQKRKTVEGVAVPMGENAVKTSELNF